MTTSLKRNEPTWPFLLVLIALFILSVTSPRAWRIIERPDPPQPVSGGTFVVQEPASQRQMSSPALPPSSVSPSRANSSLNGVPSQSTDGWQPANLHSHIAQNAEAKPPVSMFPPQVEPEEPCFESAEEHSLMSALPSEQAAVAGDDNNYGEIAWGKTPERESGPGTTPAVTAEPASRNKCPHALWTPPNSLFALLEPFASRPETRDWVRQIRETIDELGSNFEAGEDALPIIQKLYGLAREGDSLQSNFDPEPALAAQFRQLRYALMRRISLWKAIQLAGGLRVELAAAHPADWDRLWATLKNLDERLGEGSTAQAWREFLGVEEMRAASRENEISEKEGKLSEIAARILARVDRQSLTEAQELLLEEPPVAEYLDELRFWSGSSIQAAGFLARIENFESLDTNSAAEPIILAYYRLSRSSEARARWVARCVDLLYRNANLRIAITEELLNRLAPDRPGAERPVAETILNRPVYGNSYGEAKVAFRLIPDPVRARVTLLVRGHVTSITYACAGPATIWNDGYAQYVAEKAVEITPRGLVAAPAVINVENSVRIRDVATSLDSIPVLGFLTQEVARQQAARRRVEANEEARWKLAAQALREIETETESQFSKLNKRWQEEILGPLHRFGLTPTWLSAQTNKERLILRVRLATALQPGGHTLRPFAPADSLASCQVHQSAVNNFLARLGLEGQTYTVAELQQKLREKLRLPEEDAREENPHADARVTFASQDAARVEFSQGKLIITLAISNLSSPPHRWQDFQVRAIYRPEIHNDRIQFVREGVIQLVGPMDMRSQIALRSIFSRTFSKEKPWEVSPGFLQRHEKLADLTVSQLVLENGWLGFAVGRRPTVALREKVGQTVSQ